MGERWNSETGNFQIVCNELQIDFPAAVFTSAGTCSINVKEKLFIGQRWVIAICRLCGCTFTPASLIGSVFYPCLD